MALALQQVTVPWTYEEQVKVDLSESVKFDDIANPLALSTVCKSRQSSVQRRLLCRLPFRRYACAWLQCSQSAAVQPSC